MYLDSFLRIFLFRWLRQNSLTCQSTILSLPSIRLMEENNIKLELFKRFNLKWLCNYKINKIIWFDFCWNKKSIKNSILIYNCLALSPKFPFLDIITIPVNSDFSVRYLCVSEEILSQYYNWYRSCVIKWSIKIYFEFNYFLVTDSSYRTIRF